VVRHQKHVAIFSRWVPRGTSMAFSPKMRVPVGQLGHQGPRIDGHRQNPPAHVQDLRQGLNSGRETSGIAEEHGQQQVAGVVASEAAVFDEALQKQDAGYFTMRPTRPRCI